MPRPVVLPLASAYESSPRRPSVRFPLAVRVAPSSCAVLAGLVAALISTPLASASLTPSHWWAQGYDSPVNTTSTASGSTGGGPQQALFQRGGSPGTPAGQWFDHFMIVIFENIGYTRAIADPNFAKYAARGRLLTNYFAVAHPSAPNYVALIGGDTLGVVNNSDISLQDSSLYNLMDTAGLTYSGYHEGYKGKFNCFSPVPAKNPGRFRWHNPLLNFDYVRNDPGRCARFRGWREFDQDLNAGKLPNWSFFTPTRVHNGHDTNIGVAGKWMDTFLTTRLPKFPAKSMVAIVFDEDDERK